MKWAAVTGMKLRPYRCAGCGSSPRETQETDRPPSQAYFAEGVDINWGDALYICGSCANVIGQLHGMADVDEFEGLKAKLEVKERELKNVTADRDKLEDRIDRMLDGVKAKKEAAKARQSRAKKVAA